MKRNISFLLAIILMISITTGCTSHEQAPATPPPADETATPTQTPAPTPSPTPAPTPTPVPEETPQPSPEPVPVENEEPAYRNPLNGAPLAAPWTVRPFAVMINNIMQAQPQCGIGNADIIYEVLVEGVTRMMAIYSDIRDVKHLGSIRSIRPYYLDISLGYGAISVHAGASPAAYDRIRIEKINDLDGGYYYGGEPGFYYDQTRRSSGYAMEHSYFGEGGRIYEIAEEQGYSMMLPEDYDNGLNFVRDATPEDGETCEKVLITFGMGKQTELEYHADSGTYTAKQYGSDYTDGNTKEPVEFRNVIAIDAETHTLDGSGRLSVNLFDTGVGYYACGGKLVPITWQRDNVNDCFHYFLENGNELNISEGRTYICILARNQGTFEYE